MSYAQHRIDRVRASMEEQGLEAFLIRNLSNIKWATAFDGVFDDEDAHALLITREQAVLHTDSRYAQVAMEAASGSAIAVDGQQKSHAEFVGEVLEGYRGEEPPESVSGGVGMVGRRIALGIESSMTLGEFRTLEKALADHGTPVDIHETYAFALSLREIKDAKEIERLRFAQSITDAAFAHIVGFIRPGLTEREVQIELENYMIRHRASGLAFSSIVASGANGANPHAIPGDRPLESGQAVVLDFGARAKGYCSDMTRMVFLGEPDDAMKRAYEALREANETVESMLRPGVTGAEAQRCAEAILARHGFADMMGHSLGHGVGIDVHEEPVLATRNEKPLAPGNVVTVEPGIYIPHSFGMRLEDFGVVTQEGFDVFTQSGHDMVII